MKIYEINYGGGVTIPTQLSDEDAKRYGVFEATELVIEVPDTEANSDDTKTDAKQAPAPENKQVAATENKAAADTKEK